jgi:hypothetical protein
VIGSLNPDDPSTLKFTHTESAHEAVFSFLVAVAGFGSLVDVYKSKPEEGAKPWAYDHYALFESIQYDVTLKWKPNIVLHSAVNNGIPYEISFEQFDVEARTAGETVNMGALNHFIFGLSQMMVVSYVENHKGHLNAKYGPVDSWPAVWQFARIVRNAMSHGNKVNITDGKTATWKGLTYSPSENGRTVVNADLLPGDLIVMLREWKTRFKVPELPGYEGRYGLPLPNASNHQDGCLRRCSLRKPLPQSLPLIREKEVRTPPVPDFSSWKLPTAYAE